jgi:hypothetical protein
MENQEAGTMKAVFAPFMLVAALFVALTTGFAQSASPSALHWTDGAANATSEVKNDVKIEGLKSDDIHIFVSLADVKETEYNRVWVQVANHGKAPIDFNPQAAVLLKGDKSVRAEVPDKAAKSIQKVGEAKAQELSSAHCDFMQTGGGKGGGSQAGGAGCSATPTQVQMSKQVLEFSNKQAQWVRDNGLSQKTLAPEEEVQGAIVFRKDKKSADYILRVPIGGEVFEFPLNAQNKAPSYD